jgi:hypothetical protein
MITPNYNRNGIMDFTMVFTVLTMGPKRLVWLLYVAEIDHLNAPD